MRYPLKLDKNRIQIFHEGHKRRLFVGELIYDEKKDKYSLIYDRHYTHAKNAIPLGPNLSLFKLKHDSQKGKMFPIFMDRIPDKANPAYADYCASQHISLNEKNVMVLLGTIGRRGPSSFVFEPVYSSDFSVNDIAKFREALSISQYDFALAFDISQATLQRIESGDSTDLNTLKRIEILLSFPEVALWQLKQTGLRIHKNSLSKLKQYFKQMSTVDNG